MQNQIVPIDIAEIFAGVNELQDRFSESEHPEDEEFGRSRKDITTAFSDLRFQLSELIEQYIIHWAKAKNQSEQ